MTFWEVLQRRVRSDGAHPLLTCYGSDGGRTELSAITYANWVAKTANMLTDAIGAGTGDRVALPLLVQHPGHWMGLVWVGACWTAGVDVASEPQGDEVAVVSGPALDFGDTSGDRLACSLHPLALGFSTDLPDGVIDWASEVKGEPDAYLGAPPMADDLAWGGLTQAAVLASDPVANRVLIDCGESWEPLSLVRAALVGPLLGGGSSVQVLAGDPASIAAGERARVITPL